jgi:membrane protein implicated in regulation of membrane protease activity
MAQTPRRVLSCLFLLAVATLHAQAPTQPAATTITLGQAAVPLYGPWKFHIGDSPIDPKTGKPLWAEPDFDDSQWETVDLTPKQGAVDPMAGLSGYVPGWTARGHAGIWGYGWYRIQVRFQGQGSQPLALAGPADVDDAYQAFADGALLGSFGDFSGTRPVVYPTRPILLRLGPQANGSDGARVLAFRIWMDPSTLLGSPDAGGMHDAPLLGEAGIVTLHYQSQWLELIRGYLFDAIAALAFGLLAVVAFSLILFDRSDPVYLWIGLLFLATAALNIVVALSAWTSWIPAMNFLLILEILNPLIYALWVIVWWVWFGRRGFRWLPGVVAGLTALLMVSGILADEVFPGLVSHSAAHRFHAVSDIGRFALFGLLAWIVADGIRRQGLEGWLALPIVLLRGVASFEIDLARLHIPVFWSPFGMPINVADIANFLIAALIALLLLRRLFHSVKRQRQMALDVRQAQEVQQVILPERRVVLPGFDIESEYRPAREVGGDFFQIIPNEKDGSLLIVAGDVTGKGLKAGMLVALLVGAIRTAVRFTSDPTAILAELNQRLLGRGDAQATCLALHVERNGSATLANAGHLPPYLNGKPMEIDGSLPLGMVEQFESSVHRFQLAPKDRLLLLSDGVAEATDTNGRLFGFERVLELVRTQPSATQIAETAQAFGQEDDISVIAVTRIAAPEPALA